MTKNPLASHHLDLKYKQSSSPPSVLPQLSIFRCKFFWQRPVVGMVTSQVSITIPNYCFSHNISYLPRQFVTPSLAAPLPVIVQIFYILFQPPNLVGLYPSSLPVFSCRLIVLFVPTNRTLLISWGLDQLILLFKYNNNIDNLLGLINRTIAKYRFIFQVYYIIII